MAPGVVFKPSPWGVFTLYGEGGGIRPELLSFASGTATLPVPMSYARPYELCPPSMSYRYARPQWATGMPALKSFARPQVSYARPH
jgi:hypothetical protein